MHPFVTQGSLQYVLLLSLGSIVRGQTYSTLPSPPHYDDGAFTSPNTSTTQVFTNGSKMNVSWYTDYEKVNLYFIYGTDYNKPWTCITGTTQMWLVVTLDDHGNNTDPFSFRAVNEEGTTEEQQSGGFYTGQFWISPASDESSTSSLVSSSTSSLVSSSTSTLVGSSTSSLMSSSTSSLASLSTGTSTTISSSSSAATTTPSTSILSSGTSSSGNSDIVIGVGVGVGVGVAAALLMGGFFLWRRNRRRSRRQQQQAVPSYAGDNMTHQVNEKSEWFASIHPASSTLPSYDVKKHAKQPPVEVPDVWQEPRELP